MDGAGVTSTESVSNVINNLLNKYFVILECARKKQS